MVLFLALGCLETSRSIFYAKPSILFEAVVCMGSVVLIMKWINGLKHNQERNITLFWIFTFLISMIAHYHGNTGYFDHSEDTFYFGYINALFEGIIVARIPKLSYRTTFSASAAIIRAIVIPPKDKSLLIVQSLCFCFIVFLDFDKEKHDKGLFGSYFHYKEQLVKFKNLVAQDIPEGIVIITQDLTACLFMNSYFRVLINEKSNSLTSDIRSHLHKFLLQENLPDSQEDNSPTQNQPDMTLLSFLSTEISSQNSHKRFSCNVSYKRPQETELSFPSNNPLHQVFEVKILHTVWDEMASLAIIFHDITQQQTIMSLKVADMHKDKILATVSHELRTPLNSILGMVQIMLKQVQDQELRHYLNICKNSGNLLLGLVNSILDLNQIRAKKFKLVPEKVELRTLLKDIIHLFEVQCSHKGIYLKTKVSPFAPIYLITDKNRLSQVFINLLGNALKFTNSGGITISVNNVADRKEYLEFSVEDTGIGIKKEDQYKLFKMFGKLEQEDTNVNHQGVGLGLTISDSLVRLLGNSDIEDGGRIKLESEYEKGCKFSFWIRKNIEQIPHEEEPLSFESPTSSVMNTSSPRTSPFKEDEIPDKVKSHLFQLKRSNTLQMLNLSALMNSRISSTLTGSLGFPPSLQASPSKSKGFNCDNTIKSKEGLPCVLVVDDNSLNIMVAENLIASHKCQVKTALTGHAAINLLLNNNHNTEPIKLILMDCQMPIMDGYETTKTITGLMKEKKIPEIPIVALTANDSEADKDVCRKAGMSGYLSKPLKDKDLDKILKKYCQTTSIGKFE